MSNQLIIAGFHRSGTSLVSQLLYRAGVFLGDDLVKANESNVHGHFEDWEIRRLHDEILADNGLNWMIEEPLLPVIDERYWRRMQRSIERRNTSHKIWGFKDPRVCLFMGQWKYLLPEAKILLVYRHFADSTHSLHRRHANEIFRRQGPQHLHWRFFQEPDLALRMWLVHNRALLAFARTYPEDVLAVSLDMVQNGFPVIEAVNRRWGWSLEEVPTQEVFDRGIAKGRQGRQPVSDTSLIEPVKDTWKALEELGERTEKIMGGEKVV